MCLFCLPHQNGIYFYPKSLKITNKCHFYMRAQCLFTGEEATLTLNISFYMETVKVKEKHRSMNIVYSVMERKSFLCPYIVCRCVLSVDIFFFLQDVVSVSTLCSLCLKDFSSIRPDFFCNSSRSFTPFSD